MKVGDVAMKSMLETNGDFKSSFVCFPKCPQGWGRFLPVTGLGGNVQIAKLLPNLVPISPIFSLKSDIILTWKKIQCARHLRFLPSSRRIWEELCPFPNMLKFSKWCFQGNMNRSHKFLFSLFFLLKSCKHVWSVRTHIPELKPGLLVW